VLRLGLIANGRKAAEVEDDGGDGAGVGESRFEIFRSLTVSGAEEVEGVDFHEVDAEATGEMGNGDAFAGAAWAGEEEDGGGWGVLGEDGGGEEGVEDLDRGGCGGG
jgi:hypothetical protein